MASLICIFELASLAHVSTSSVTSVSVELVSQRDVIQIVYTATFRGWEIEDFSYKFVKDGETKHLDTPKLIKSAGYFSELNNEKINKDLLRGVLIHYNDGTTVQYGSLLIKYNLGSRHVQNDLSELYDDGVDFWSEIE